jgi:hypothetical protein
MSTMQCSYGVPYFKKYVKKSMKKYKPPNSPKKSTPYKVGTLKVTISTDLGVDQKPKDSFYNICFSPPKKCALDVIQKITS